MFRRVKSLAREEGPAIPAGQINGLAKGLALGTSGLPAGKWPCLKAFKKIGRITFLNQILYFSFPDFFLQ